MTQGLSLKHAILLTSSNNGEDEVSVSFRSTSTVSNLKTVCDSRNCKKRRHLKT